MEKDSKIVVMNPDILGLIDLLYTNWMAKFKAFRQLISLWAKLNMELTVATARIQSLEGELAKLREVVASSSKNSGTQQASSEISAASIMDKYHAEYTRQ